MPKKLPFALAAALMLCAATYSQQVSIKEKLPNGEYIILVDGVEQRTVTADHARQIAVDKLEAQKVPVLENSLNEQKKLIDLQTSQIADYRKLADLDTRLLGIAQQMDTIRTEQHADSLARAKDAKNILDIVSASQVAGKGTWLDRALDKVYVKGAMVGLGVLANGRTAFFPPSPCAPMPAPTAGAQRGVAFRFDLKLGRKP
jgi:hypothetical protein